MLKAFLFHARYIINELDISCSLLEKRYLGCRSGLNISMKTYRYFLTSLEMILDAIQNYYLRKYALSVAMKNPGFFQ